VDGVVQHGGKELSYLNLFDADAAWRLVHELAADAPGEVAVAIIKHANPCGAAVAGDLVTAYERALKCDEQSAFGGIVAIGGPVDEAVAEAIAAGPQADVIVAPSYAPAALAQLASRRKATRLLEAPGPEPIERQLRGLGNAVLVQGPDRFESRPESWQVVTKATPPAHSGATSCWPGGSARGPPRTPSPSSPTARRSVWVPVSSLGWWPPRSP